MKLGKLAPADLRTLLDYLPVLRQEEALAHDLQFDLKESGRWNKAAEGRWCDYYELPVNEHLARIIVAFGFADEIKAIASAPNPVVELADAFDRVNQTIDAIEDEGEEAKALVEALPAIFGMTISISRTLRCLMVYGCYLNELIVKVRQGDDKALFNAVRIDPTVIGCASVVGRISRAVLEQDGAFLNDFRLAIGGPFTKREQANFQSIRFVLQVLHEAGAGRLRDDDLYQLFAEELKLYARESESEAGDVARNLRKFADQFMKAKPATTEIAEFSVVEPDSP